MLICDITGAFGVVSNPTKEEWGKAFHAPANPYRWFDNSRVTIKSEGKK